MADLPALTAFVQRLQAELWHDLDDDLRAAANGVWSIGAANRARMIIEAARLVGPTPTDQTPWRLVSGGIYEAVLTAGGITYAMPDGAEMARLNELMSTYGTVGKDFFAATIAKIQTPRETAWINGDDE